MRPTTSSEPVRRPDFEIAFRREGTCGDAVVPRTRGLAGQGEASFAHELRSEAGGHELARAPSVWRRLP